MSVVSASLESGRICVCASGDTLEKGREFAGFLGCPLNPTTPAEFFFKLHVEPGRTYVLDQQKRLLEIDFDKNHLDYERKGHRGKNELIARALGVAKGSRKILDLSVGMGIDSVFLTQLGFQVVGVERSPVLYLLLRDALSRTSKEYLQSYQLHFGDSLQFLKNQKGRLEVDAIYFDPMYPHKKKSALPKQEMVVFRDLVGHDEDAAQVLQEALSWPVRRVVVKRPRQAEVLLPGVQHAYEGKVVRYDTYVVG